RRHGSHELVQPRAHQRSETLAAGDVSSDRCEHRDPALAVPVGGDVSAEEGRGRAQRRPDGAMDHRATIGLSDRIHVELRQHNSEARTAITCRGDPLAHRGDQDAIQIRLGDRLRARWRGLGDQRERMGLGVAKQSPERRQHRRPTLAFGHALRGAERGEADRRRRGRRDVPALEQRPQRPAGFDIETRQTGAEHPTSAELAKGAIAEGFSAVIVAGGDGTVAPAAEALLDSPITLGILPFGSFMNVAKGLGIPLEPIDAARLIAERKLKRCDVGEVGKKVFFETCGIGLDADAFGAARLVERGRWAGAWRRLVRWATASPHRIEITIDGRTARYEVLQVLIVNSPYYAWALPVVPRAD